MTPASPQGAEESAPRVPYEDLVGFAADVFAARGVPTGRARTAAKALVYGDLAGMRSHGLTNLTRLYLPLFDDKRVEPDAEPEVLADKGASVLLDGKKGLGLWLASEAIDLAAERAAEYGIGLVSVRDATHFGCAGYHTLRAAERDMVGILASNCGGQRIARPPGGKVAMLGTNPMSIASPAGPDLPPYCLDMSTTAVPTGKIRQAARAGQSIPEGWLTDAQGQPVTDPHALDRGDGFPTWLGGRPETGAYKGYGLALLVEVLAALVPGAGLGPAPEAYEGSGGPSGRDDDIGILAIVVAPGALRPVEGFLSQAGGLFQSLLDCPPIDPAQPVSYPGAREAATAEAARADGVPITPALHEELREVAERWGLEAPVGVDA
ncbi:Ldh family oxidoreductase [Streptomyces sp. AC563]|uniref:Ldh family oxidoreductase n=1 Tax=Streptomyces buecherae TaxID=2763006 RepID=UPI00164EA501|nr:Ldh family oxidoreductase [Streptomyces buecherae]MBC3989969.1 Ldh family oxidoreductase [Streptomyces buecherae]